MSTLIPCPHCGQTDDGLEVSQFHQVLNLWHVKCERCTAQVIGGTEQEARTHWNRRHSLHAMLQKRPEMMDELFSLLRTNASTYMLYDYDVRLSTGIMPDQLKADVRTLVLAWVQKMETLT